MSEEIHGPELRALEANLAALTPAGDIDRDRIMFRAGQASGRPRPGWRWPCATGVLAVVSVALAGVVVLRPGPRVAERMAQVPQPVPRHAPDLEEPPQETPAPPMRNNLAQTGRNDPWPDPTGPRALERQVLRWGLDAIPPPRATASAAPTLSVEGLLGLPRKRAAQPGTPFPANLFLHGDRS
jgi:hypothetical protein